MFENGFPKYILKQADKILELINENAAGVFLPPFCDNYNSEYELYMLSNGEKIRFPYRIYLNDSSPVYDRLTDITEKLIYDCVFTRSNDGHIREKHALSILNSDIPEFCFPYLMRLSSEYSVEIIKAIYDGFKKRNNDDIAAFCQNNRIILERAYKRMESYWNVYYRKDCPEFEKYVGYSLFSDVFCVNNT